MQLTPTVAALLTSAVVAGNHCSSTSATGIQYCLYGTSDPAVPGNVLITVHAESQGWAAIGTGDRMKGSSIITGWKNSTGGYVVSDRTATAHALPAYASSQVSQLVSLAVPAPSWASIAFTVSRPAGTLITSKTSYIFAYSDTAAKTPDVASSSFTEHDDYDKLGAVDLTQ
ncbi:hypothetical protein HDU91_001503 [Kappamyces sp. JEL0680]|nr:hypothetical protein HDU91_001503 [Kappamyces sp. JEL0680]